MSREENFALHQKYRTLWESDEVLPRPNFYDTPKIKIGFISNDFFGHAVAHFLDGLFSNYDKSKFEIHLFAEVGRTDGITERFKGLTDGWHDISRLTDKQAVELIKKEKITALVDLSGHTGGNRLGVFGLRAAPLQITYCGYPNTTGLKSMDYRISDAVCEPEDAQNYHSEKLYKMPDCFLNYNLQDRCELPDTKFECLENRAIVFGSFNNLRKYTTETMRLWANVVNAVPNSKLLLKYRQFSDPAVCEVILSRFADLGLSKERIELVGLIGNKEHLELYNKMDIALDCFPYNGTTTTCEATLMGVPTITILGDRHVSRVSASLLTAVGHPELVAENDEEFVEIAKNLALDTKRLAEVKTNLRAKMLSSPLCDAKGFAKKFETAITDMIAEIKAKEV